MGISVWRATPADPADWFDDEELARSRSYQRPLRRWGAVHKAARLALSVGLIAAGVPVAVAGVVDGWVVQLLVVVVAVAVYDTLVDLPVLAWRELGHDRRWGFSTTTPATFVLDQVKSIALYSVLLAALGLPIWALIRTTEVWWLWAWGVMVAFSLLLAVLLPAVILPVFNRYEPLADDDLRTRLLGVAAQAGADITEVEVQDASRRTRRDNAFVAGLGRTRKVVLFDNILDRPADQIATVVAHEIGHWKRRHILRSVPFGAAVQLVSFAVLFVVVTSPPALDLAGVDRLGDPAAVPLFLLVLQVVMKATGLATAWLSRVHERQADLYALRLLGQPATFMATMRDLHTDNLADLAPSLWKRLTHTHPPAAERLAMGEAFAAEVSAAAAGSPPGPAPSAR